MDFDMQTATPVEETAKGVNRVSGFDIGSARAVDAPGGKTEFDKLKEAAAAVDAGAQKTETTPGLNKAVRSGTMGDYPDPGFLKSTAVMGMENIAELATKPLGIEVQGLKEDKERLATKHPVGAIIAGTAPFIATAPLFPSSLVGLAAQFATVSGLNELGRQRVDESMMKPVAEKAGAVAKETTKGALMGPIWHYSGALKFVGRPFASALARAGTIGVGTASLDKVYGDDITSAFKDGGTMAALSLIFESPSLAKSVLGRGIIAHSNSIVADHPINPEAEPDAIKQQVLDKVNKMAEQIPQKPEIVSAAVKVGDKTFDGSSHEDALNKAGESKDTMKEGEDFTAHFRTSDGRVIDRKQAQEEFGISGSEEVPGLNQQKYLTPQEDIKITNPETLKGIAEGEEGKMNVNMIPGVPEAAHFLEAAHTDYVETLKPMDASEAAKITAKELRANIGEMARSHDRFEASMRQASKIFEKADKKSIIDSYTKAEKGERQENPELQGIYDTLKKTLLDKAQEVKGLGTGKLEDLIENYMPHIWTKPGKAQAAFGKFFGKKPFEGGKSFLKQRIIGDFSKGIELGLEPVSWNPVDLTMMKLREMDKYIMAHKTLNALKAQGIMKFVKLGGEVPEGFKKANDSISDVYSKGDNGELILRGRWYGQKDAVRIIDNYLSPGLQGKFVYDLYRGAGNTLNQFQLGMSAFHLGFTSMDATVSKFALGLNKLAAKNYAGALKEWASAPLAPVTNYMEGKKLLESWRGESNDPLTNKIADLMASAGGRAKMDKFYATGMRDQMAKALKEGKTLTIAMKTPMWLVEQMSRPIMEHIVPAQKAGVFHDLMKFELEQHPDWTHEQMVDKAQKAWDSVDNRMGQLVYDNLFWNKTVKDLSMASIRSLGWNLGTIREIGGGIKDMPLNIKSIAKGEGMSYRTAYVMALPMVAGLYGALYQYMATGKGPEELKDYWFPKNGGIDKNGEPSRVSLPTYMKDIYHYKSAPVQTVLNKLNPVNNMVMDMLLNRDFFGTKIINEDDPLVQKGLDELKFAAAQFMPFSVSNMGKSTKDDIGSKVQPFVGITPAPYDVSMTKAERAAADMSKGKIPIGSRTKEQAARSKTKSDIRNKYIQNKDIEQLDQAVKDGKITLREKHDIVKESKMTTLQRQTNHLSYEEVQTLYAKATDKEKPEIDKILKKKKSSKQRAGTWTKDEESMFKKHFGY